MEQATANLGQTVASAKQFARRLLTIGQNRFALLRVEVQEECERLLRALLLAFGAVALGFFAAVALSVLFVVCLWEELSPVAVLLALTGLQGAAAVFLYLRLKRLLRGWQNLPATLDQLRKDRVCLGKCLE